MSAVLRSPNRLAAGALGVVALAGGIVVSLLDRPLLGLVFYGAPGVALVLGSMRGVSAARAVNVGVGTAWAVLGYVGLFLAGTPLDVFEITALDEVALFAGATIVLAIGLGARRDKAPRR